MLLSGIATLDSLFIPFFSDADDHMKLKRIMLPKSRAEFNSAFMVLGMLEMSVPVGGVRLINLCAAMS